MNAHLLLIALAAVNAEQAATAEAGIPPVATAPAAARAEEELVFSDPPILTTWSVTEKPADVPFEAPNKAVAEKKAGGAQVKADPAPAGQVREAPRVEKPAEDSYNRLGLVLDAGVPDGLGASATFRPFKWLRLHAGAVGNGVSTGFRGGVTLAPLHTIFRPTLTAEAGRYFDGDASWLLGEAPDPTLKTLLSSIGYDFANAHLGLELGGDNFGFFLRGGLSYVDLKVTNLAAAIPSPAGTITGEAGHLRAVLPSLKLGFLIHFI